MTIMPRNHHNPLDMAYRAAHTHERRRRTLGWRDALYSDSLAAEIFLSLMLGSLGIAALGIGEAIPGLWLLGLGALRLYAIVSLRRGLRVAMAITSFFTWLLVLMYTLKNAPQFAPVFIVFALQSFWVFMRMPLDGEGK